MINFLKFTNSINTITFNEKTQCDVLVFGCDCNWDGYENIDTSALIKTTYSFLPGTYNINLGSDISITDRTGLPLILCRMNESKSVKTTNSQNAVLDADSSGIVILKYMIELTTNKIDDKVDDKIDDKVYNKVVDEIIILNGADDKRIILNNSGAVLTNFQIKVSISKQPSFRSDFLDVRVIDEDGSSLSYYIENIIFDVSADIWIKVPSFTNGRVLTLTCRNSPGSYGDPDKVFDMYDNFTTLNTSNKWRLSTTWNSNGTECDPVIENNYLKCDRNIVDENVSGIETLNDMPIDCIVELKTSVKTNNIIPAVFFRGNSASNNGVQVRFDTRGTGLDSCLGAIINKPYTPAIWETLSYPPGPYAFPVISNSCPVASDWQNIKVQVLDNVISMWHNNMLINSYSFDESEKYNTTGKIGLLTHNKGSSFVDEIKVYKATSNIIYGINSDFKIILYNSGAPLTNQQIKVHILYNGQFHPKFENIGIIDIDGTTILSHYIENVLLGVSADVWIKVPTLKNGDILTISYNNSTNPTTGIPNSVFEIYDTFEHIDLTKWRLSTSWDKSDTVPYVENNYLRCDTNSGLETLNDMPNDVVIEIKTCASINTCIPAIFVRGTSSNNYGIQMRYDTRGDVWQTMGVVLNNPYNDNESTILSCPITTATFPVISGTEPLNNDWQLLKAQILGNKIQLWCNGQSIYTYNFGTSKTYNTIGKVGIQTICEGSLYIDEIKIYKASSNTTYGTYILLPPLDGVQKYMTPNNF